MKIPLIRLNIIFSSTIEKQISAAVEAARIAARAEDAHLIATLLRNIARTEAVNAILIRKASK